MQILKLTTRRQSDFRLDIEEIRKKCKLEKYGYRHDKIIYGFCDEVPDIAELQSLGLTIEAITFDEAQRTLTTCLVERGRAKSKIDHLLSDREESGAKNEQEEAAARQKLTDLNNTIQATKEALGIAGIVKILKF